MARVLRWSSVAPTCCSRKAMARVTEGGERRSRRAAPAKLPSSITLAKIAMASKRSIASTDPSIVRYRLPFRRSLQAEQECLAAIAHSVAHGKLPHSHGFGVRNEDRSHARDHAGEWGGAGRSRNGRR